MVNPCPGYSVSTPYWKSGSAWSCGYHDGVDFAAPAGTDVVAAWSGTVAEAAYPTSFGSAFGRAVVIDHDKLPDGSPGLWGLYAHLSAESVSVGQRVEAGDKVGDVGTTGNSSGNHLHFGIYPAPHWSSCGGLNPQPWIEAGGDDMSYTYDYLGKPDGVQSIGTAYEKLDQSTWDAPKSGWENTLVYLNIKPTKWAEGKTIGAVRVRIMREADDDATAYHDLVVAKDTLEEGTTLQTYTYWEKGDGQKTHVEVRCQGGLLAADVGTRYTKRCVVY